MFAHPNYCIAIFVIIYTNSVTLKIKKSGCRHTWITENANADTEVSPESYNGGGDFIQHLINNLAS